MATFMSIVKYEVDDATGAVHFISGFTKPYGETSKKPKVPVKKPNMGDIDKSSVGVVEL